MVKTHSIIATMMKQKFSDTKIFLLILVSIFCSAQKTFSQTAEEQFGQNRVQYKDLSWSYYSTNHFDVYFYLGGQDIGKFVVLAAEKQTDDIERKLEYKVQDKIEILVYNMLGDMKQTNVGGANEDNNIGGTTKIIGNKMLVYFNGNHLDLLREIKQGIAEIYIQNMMNGGNIQEVLQNAVLLNLPNWYTEGLVSYVGENWNAELDNQLRDGILSKRYKNFTKLNGADASFAGQSLWQYIADTYGASTIPNILYLTRLNRSVESGFMFVLGKSVKQTLTDWYSYYEKQYTQDALTRTSKSESDLLMKKYKPQIFYSQMRINTDATKLAFTMNEIGKYKVCMRDLEKNKNKILLRGGFKNLSMPVDYSYPLVAWDPAGKKLVMIYERRGAIYLNTYDTESKKKTKKSIANFQKVLSISFTNDSKVLAVSAMNRGQSDIYLYNYVSGRTEQITNDFYDDLNPRFVKLNNRQGIVWESNRTNDTLVTRSLDTLLPIDNFDIYFFNTQTKSKTIVKVTNTEFLNEKNPLAYNTEFFSYLSDSNGIYNRYVAYIDSFIHHYDHYFYFNDSTVVNPIYNADSLWSSQKIKPDSSSIIPVWKDFSVSKPITNYTEGIIEQDIAWKKGLLTETMFINGKREIYTTKIQSDLNGVAPLVLVPTYLAQQLNKRNKPKTIELIIPPIQKKDSVNHDVKTNQTDTAKIQKVDINNYYFQSDFTTNSKNNSSIKDTTKKTAQTKPNFKKNPLYRYSKVKTYLPKFSTASVTTSVDNSLLVSRYQNFAANYPLYSNPPLSALIKLSIQDVLEDYRFTGGFRIPDGFNGSEYFLAFENLQKRLDHRFVFYTKTNKLAYDFRPQWYLNVNAKSKIYLAEYDLKYPIDYTKSLRGSFGYRQDKVVFLSTDTFSLHQLQDPYREDWAQIRLEYVFDNTIPVQLNILNGTRYKFYFEAHKMFNTKGVTMFNAGVDFRNYHKIHRQITLASRFNAATSFGKAKVNYFLGGVDSWLPAQFDFDTKVDDQAGYYFQTLATNLRGFKQNVRNGNSYALLNEEIRFPVFTYLFNTPIRSELIKNFQLVPFFDVGTAWQGNSPYAVDNPFNTNSVTQGPVTVNVNYFREPVVYGYGIGARTVLFGYFVRFDYAFGVDSGAKQAPIFYFSLTKDF